MVIVVTPENATLWGGGFIPSITNSFLTNDCLKSGKLFCRLKNMKDGICFNIMQQNKFNHWQTYFLKMVIDNYWKQQINFILS